MSLRFLACVALILALAASPKAFAYEIFWGNLHSHCQLSDGIGTPEEAFAYARDVANIDVLALTDHTHMLTQTEWEYLGEVAAEYTEDGVFVAMQAQEFGKLNDFGHLGIYDVPYRNPNATTNLPATYNFILTYDGLGNFCHPNPDYGTWFDDFNFEPEWEEAMHSIEMRNGLRGDDYEPEANYALGKGWKLGFFANQDNHNGMWGDQPNPNDGGAIYLTGILADNLTYDEIVAAIRARRFYAQEEDPPGDRIKLWYWVNGNDMGSMIESTGPLTFTGHAESVNGISVFNRAELFRDGELVDSQVIIGTQIDYEFDDTIGLDESHYYYLRVRQVDGDYAWSAPVWVQQSGSSSTDDPRVVSSRGVSLLPNTPNPFSPYTKIRYESSGVMEGPIKLTIHDVTGRRVRDLGLVNATTGVHQVTWDGRNDNGRRMGSGVYLVRLRTARGQELFQRIQLAK